MLGFLIQGAALGLSGAASPGPFQAFLIAQTLRLGWQRAIWAVLAPLITDGPIIALVLLVLTRLPPVFMRAVQLIGGLFVLYLAWRSLQAFRAFHPAEIDPGAARKTLLQAVLMNFLSPGPYLFWSLISGPVLIRGWNQSAAHAAAFLAGFYGAMVGGLIFLVVLFSAARQFGSRVQRGLLGFSALILAGFGLYQLWSGLFQ